MAANRDRASNFLRQATMRRKVMKRRRSSRLVAYFCRRPGRMGSSCTWVNPAGTSKSDGSAAEEEKLVTSRVISINDPEAEFDPASLEFAGLLAPGSGCASFFFLPNPPRPSRPPNAAPSASPTDAGGGLELREDCDGEEEPSGMPSIFPPIFIVSSTGRPSILDPSFASSDMARCISGRLISGFAMGDHAIF